MSTRTTADPHADPIPADAGQEEAPFADAIRAFHEREMLAFGIPAHAAGAGPLPDAAAWTGADAVRADPPLSHGLDTRDRAWGVQATAQRLFAEAIGARRSWFSTSGSSMSVRVALLALGAPDREVVIARNGHKSTFAGLVLSGARPIWVEPVYDEDLEIALGPRPEDVAAALDAHPGAAGALVFTPSYYGTACDVAGIADACHERGVPLVTDDAWGLDLELVDHPDLPRGSLSQGADLAIGSAHKTLGALAQTSVLSLGSDRIDPDLIQRCFELEESTSTSALLLSSIDGARRQFAREGRDLADRALATAELLRGRLADEVPELPVVAPERLAAREGVVGVLPTRVMLETGAIGLSGFAADDWLRDERHVDVELADHRRIMPLITCFHGPEHVDRLVAALRDLVDAHRGDAPPPGPLPAGRQLRTEQAMRPRDAFFGPTAMVDASDAAGRISAELVTPYPPGIAVLAPGERITDRTVDHLRRIVDAGAFVEGATDHRLHRFRVVTEERSA